MRRKSIIAVVAALAALAIAAPAGAATRLVTLAVHGGFATGTVMATNIDGCLGATVDTIDPTLQDLGFGVVFTGSKVVQCTTGTFTFAFHKFLPAGCPKHDASTWSITSGTGSFAGARGGGFQFGTYVPDTVCGAEAIDDVWFGLMTVP
jgi:hypothetical protein